jgi:hypothetical protein
MTVDEARARIQAAMVAYSEDREAERLGKRKKPRRHGRTEHEEQALVVKWLTTPRASGRSPWSSLTGCASSRPMGT